MTTTLSGLIEVDDQGIARVAHSRIKVIHLVMEKSANGWGPEEMQGNFPHLSLAAVYAAFTYYYDHQAECDAQIEASEKFAEEMRAANPEGPFIQRMRAEGKLPYLNS